MQILCACHRTRVSRRWHVGDIATIRPNEIPSLTPGPGARGEAAVIFPDPCITIYIQGVHGGFAIRQPIDEEIRLRSVGEGAAPIQHCAAFTPAIEAAAADPALSMEGPGQQAQRSQGRKRAPHRLSVVGSPQYGNCPHSALGLENLCRTAGDSAMVNAPVTLTGLRPFFTHHTNVHQSSPGRVPHMKRQSQQQVRDQRDQIILGNSGEPCRPMLICHVFAGYAEVVRPYAARD